MNDKSVVGTVIWRLMNTIKNNMDAISINSASHWSNTGWSVLPGTRNDFEVNCFIRGAACLHIHGEIHTPKTGDIIFLDNSEGCICGDGSFSIIFFSFSVDQSIASGKNAYLELKECFKELYGIHTSIKDENMEKLFMEMIREIGNKEPGFELGLNLLALRFLLEFMRQCPDIRQKDSSYKYMKHSHMVSDIISCLSENMENGITLAQLKDRYGLDERYINRVFKALTGYPIIRYQNRLRVEKAKRLLASGSLSMLEIALELGFENGQYLSRVFKQMTRMTPSEYKKYM